METGNTWRKPLEREKLLVYLILMIVSALCIKALIALGGAKSNSRITLINQSNPHFVLLGLLLLALFLLSLYMMAHTLADIILKRRALSAVTVPVAVITFFLLAPGLSFVGSQIAKDPVVGGRTAASSGQTYAIAFYENGTSHSAPTNASGLWGPGARPTPATSCSGQKTVPHDRPTRDSTGTT
jgi:hypothetical protein